MNKFNIKVKKNIIHSIRDKDIISHIIYGDKIYRRLFNYKNFGIEVNIYENSKFKKD